MDLNRIDLHTNRIYIFIVINDQINFKKILKIINMLFEIIRF